MNRHHKRFFVNVSLRSSCFNDYTFFWQKSKTYDLGITLLKHWFKKISKLSDDRLKEFCLMALKNCVSKMVFTVPASSMYYYLNFLMRNKYHQYILHTHSTLPQATLFRFQNQNVFSKVPIVSQSKTSIKISSYLKHSNKMISIVASKHKRLTWSNV